MLEVKQYVCGLKLKFISVERKSQGNVITLAISHKPRVTEKTALLGDPFFQLQAVAVALLRVVRLAAGFLVRLGVVVGAAEAGCMGAGAEPSGAVTGALLRAIS